MVRMPVFELLGWVASEPEPVSEASAEAKSLTLLLSVPTVEICVVSASFLLVSSWFLLAKLFSTSESTSAVMSIPDPVPSVFAIDSTAIYIPPALSVKRPAPRIF
jgi:hypothetical protein